MHSDAIRAATMSSGRRPMNLLAIGFRPFELLELRYYYLRQTIVLNETMLAKLCVIGSTFLYQDEQEMELDVQPKYFGGLLTVLNAYCSIRSVEVSGLGEALRQNGFRLKGIELDEEGLEHMFIEYWDIFAEYANMRGRLDDNIRECIVVGLSTLILIAKRLDQNFVKPWFKKRWRELASLLKCPYTTLMHVNHPDIQACNGLNKFMLSLHACRRVVFLIIRKLGETDACPYKAAFDYIIRNMWWGEATHLRMIDTHICQNNPDVLRSTEFTRTEKLNLATAYALLMGLPEEDRPFATILLKPDDCIPLQNKHFRRFYAKARAIAGLDTRIRKAPGP